MYLTLMDSAGGTISAARDKQYQAVYKLKGKILNSFGQEVTQIRANNEIDDILVISKCGAGKACDPDKSRFEKFIFLCDADCDG